MAATETRTTGAMETMAMVEDMATETVATGAMETMAMVEDMATETDVRSGDTIVTVMTTITAATIGMTMITTANGMTTITTANAIRMTMITTADTIEMTTITTATETIDTKAAHMVTAPMDMAVTMEIPMVAPMAMVPMDPTEIPMVMVLMAVTTEIPMEAPTATVLMVLQNKSDQQHKNNRFSSLECSCNVE